MERYVYTVLDEKAKQIGPLFIATSDAEAQRSVSMALRGDSLMSRYPADFSLLCVCAVDTVDGHVYCPAEPSDDGKYPELVCKLDEIVLPAEK